MSIESTASLPRSEQAMNELKRSHGEPGAAVIAAGKQIRKLNFGRPDGPVLAVVRRVPRDSRAVARNEGIAFGTRADLKKQGATGGDLFFQGVDRSGDFVAHRPGSRDAI